MDSINLNTELQQCITSDQAWYYSIVPKRLTHTHLYLYIADDKDAHEVKHELELIYPKQIELESLPAEVVRHSIAKYYRLKNKPKNGSEIAGMDFKSEDFLLNLINEAHAINASDIHIEAYEERCRIRLRVDGKLMEKYILKKEEYPAIINKIKIQANIDIAEKRLPQDGRIFFNENSDHFDIRVSVLPTLYGEKIVLRLLSRSITDIDICQLGFSEQQLNQYLESIKKPHGIILISGPTGSGKTTTLYATLKILNSEQSNILTIEDPIEYTLEGINQVQLKEAIGLTFASALRTFLRQDPDIIMLGEIRDPETAQMAVRAALTGHLVLSTVHTNSAWGIISRLIDMGIPPFLVESTLNLSVAQRLVRILCPECKQKADFESSRLPSGFNPAAQPETHYIPIGCESCYFTGYKGRKAVYEIIPTDPELLHMIRNNQNDISETLNKKGIKLLAETAYQLFSQGLTSIDEIYPILTIT